MKYVLAVLQILLGLQFIFVGGNKVITPVAQLAEQWAWVAAVPPFSVPVIGVLEVLGGLGLILPWLTGIQPQLVRLAAAGLALTMVGALITHIAIGDPFGSWILPIVLGALLSFIAYARTSILPLSQSA